MKRVLLLIAILTTSFLYAQDYLMQNGTIATCTGTFYDTGGADGQYQSNEDLTITFCPDGGDAILLEFTAFNVENSFETLSIYDGDSTSAPLMGEFTGTNSPGTIGASFDNTTGCLTLVFHSDSSVTRDGWAATISCYTPEYIEAFPIESGAITTCSGAFYDTGGVYGDYTANEDVTMTISPLDIVHAIRVDFTQFNLENNWDFLYVYDGVDTSATLLGTYSGTSSPGIVEASTDNNSGSLTFRFTSDGSGNRSGWVGEISCFIQTLPDEPVYGPCSVLDVSPDAEVGCQGGPCTEITANLGFSLIAGGADTSAYTISNVECPLEIESGTPVSVNIDDRWSEAIDISFDFSFFGNTYNQLLIGSNGLVTFELEDAGGFCAWSFDESAPDPNLQTNAIFGAYHDIDPSVCGEISYYITGTAPYRAFVVSYIDVCHFSCNSLMSTQHIILWETSNIIDVYIEDKPTCSTWNGGNALIGIQNQDGTVAYVPQDRNTGPWTTSDEKWRFIPDDELDVDYEFEWLDESGAVVSNDLSTWVCPTEDTVYTAHLTYTLNGEEFELTNQVNVTYGGDSTVIANQPDDLSGCLDEVDGVANFDLTTVEAQIVGSQTDVTLSYYSNFDDADAGVNPIDTPNSIYVDSDYVIWVRIDDDNSDCYALTNFSLLTIDNGAILTDEPEDFAVCTSDEFGSFDLTQQDAAIIEGFQNATVSYYETEEDANAGSNPLMSPYTNTSNPQTVFVRLETENGCYGTSSFDLLVNAVPDFTQAEALNVCNEGNGLGIFNLEPQVQVIIGGQTDVSTSFYPSENDANLGENEILGTDLEAYSTATGLIHVRVENTTSGCFALSSFEVTVENCIPVVPNAFSPNGDNMNDIFSIDKLEDVFVDYTMKIFNRWGDVVFEGNRNTGFWDGNVDGVISTDPTGTTYFYVLEFNDGETEPLKGWVYVNP